VNFEISVLHILLFYSFACLLFIPLSYLSAAYFLCRLG
jgi:hypothetical protein